MTCTDGHMHRVSTDLPTGGIDRESAQLNAPIGYEELHMIHRIGTMFRLKRSIVPHVHCYRNDIYWEMQGKADRRFMKGRIVADNENELAEVRLFSMYDLAEMLGISHLTLYRAQQLNLFPVNRTVSRRIFVPSSDSATLTLLYDATALFNNPEFGLSFYDSIRLVKHGFTLTSQSA